jgi:GH15 family glucan-1,4-alpha-glucosidase
MAYQPIGNYGIIGNMYTTALVGMDGSIDWFCFPHHDSPSVFAAILDDKKGGRFRITPAPDGVTFKQFYWPETNVLVTRFLSPDGVGEIVDYMPVTRDGRRGKLIRSVHVIHGTMTFRVHCQPAFNYARDHHETRISEQGAAFHAPGLSLGLATDVPLSQVGDSVTAKFTLNQDQRAVFTLQQVEAGADCGFGLSEAEEQRMFEETVDYWHEWLSHCTYRGRWREHVYRSALVMKLLTFEPTGAIVAAPTASLPEGIGGVRNWDYRFTWLRDAGFTLYAFMRIGFTEEAAAFMDWLDARCHEPNPDGSLQPVYGIDGRHELHEEELTHLEGYKGSRPVRIGNAAYKQFQNDIYGAVLDAVYLYNKYGSFISYDLWSHIARLTDWVCDNWQRKDVGIWEIRAPDQNFVYSRLMCWVAIDRALRLAEKRSFPADRARWLKTRDEIYREIMTRGWNEERKAFVHYYDHDALDAANLIMPLVFFVGAKDPKMLSTIDALMQPIHSGGLMSGEMVYRYNIEESPDGLEGEEGTFNMCTFWLVEALTRAGKVDRARLIFERMIGYANHLDLYAEQTGMSGEALGNFPQAFTHLGLISAAYNLDRALDGGH